MTNVSVVFCDEIRAEANGKLFLIGTYTGEMNIAQLPARVTLQALIRFWPAPPAGERFVLEIRLDDEVTTKLEVDVEKADDAPDSIVDEAMALVTPQMNLHITQNGKISVHFGNSEKLEEVARLPFRYVPQPMSPSSTPR